MGGWDGKEGRGNNTALLWRGAYLWGLRIWIRLRSSPESHCRYLCHWPYRSQVWSKLPFPSSPSPAHFCISLMHFLFPAVLHLDLRPFNLWVVRGIAHPEPSALLKDTRTIFRMKEKKKHNIKPRKPSVSGTKGCVPVCSSFKPVGEIRSHKKYISHYCRINIVHWWIHFSLYHSMLRSTISKTWLLLK